MEKRIIDVLKSKRFWVMVIGIGVLLLIAVEPRFAGSEDQLIDNITMMVLLLIGGYSAQDMILAWLARPGSVDLSVNLAQEGIDAVEKYFQVDIPDGLEKAGIEDLQKRLHALAATYQANKEKAQ